MKISVDFSTRYMVLGLYLDRSMPTARIYPLPFVRITIEWWPEW